MAGRRRDGSQAGSGAGDDDMGPSGLTGTLPSSKVATLATDIEELETKCNHLETRNVWLTNRLLKAQQKFIERTLTGNSKVLIRRTVEGWRDALKELKLEKQLDEQTRSLDRCQQVARELGQALAEEQKLRRQGEELHKNMKEDLARAIQQEKQLRKQWQGTQVSIDIMERRVHEAENCLIRSRCDAQAVVEAANRYESRRRELENEAKDQEIVASRGGQANALEYSIKLRAEAQDTMNQVSALLRPDSRGNVMSPKA